MLALLAWLLSIAGGAFLANVVDDFVMVFVFDGNTVRKTMGRYAFWTRVDVTTLPGFIEYLFQMAVVALVTWNTIEHPIPGIVGFVLYAAALGRSSWRCWHFKKRPATPAAS